MRALIISQFLKAADLLDQMADLSLDKICEETISVPSKAALPEPSHSTKVLTATNCVFHEHYSCATMPLLSQDVLNIKKSFIIFIIKLFDTALYDTNLHTNQINLLHTIMVCATHICDMF
jgi:hypothetical protein